MPQWLLPAWRFTERHTCHLHNGKSKRSLVKKLKQGTVASKSFFIARLWPKNIIPRCGSDIDEYYAMIDADEPIDLDEDDAMPWLHAQFHSGIHEERGKYCT